MVSPGRPPLLLVHSRDQTDRDFYGEITFFAAGGGRQVNVAGSLSESDYAKLLVLIDGIEKDSIADDPGAPWDGLVAEGPVSNPRIIFRYREGAHRFTEAGRRFLELVDVMAPYLHEFDEPDK